MSGFLLNMINRHQGAVDKVQPRIRSMFEAEPISAVAMDTAFAGRADIRTRENLDTGVDIQAFSKSANSEKSAPENPPPALLSVMLQQPGQSEEGFRGDGLDSLDKNRMELLNELIQKQSLISKAPDDEEKSTPENPLSAPLPVMLQQPAQSGEGFRGSGLDSLDKNHMDLMNEQIQGVLARLGKKSEPPEFLNNQNGQKTTAPSETSDQTSIKGVSNEHGVTNSIDETLRRLISRNNNVGERKSELESPAQLSPAITIKKEADPWITLPAQPEIKGEKQGEQLIKSINDQKPVTAPITGQSGFLQTPPWLTSMQAELNNRWGEINAQSQAETVINVTIGRVEVRAINTESAKPLATQKKPTGVLSLDDYLKQRDSKGRT